MKIKEEDFNNLIKQVWNEISKFNNIKYRENKKPDKYNSEEEISQNLLVAKSKFYIPNIDITNIKNYEEIEWETDNYKLTIVDSYGWEWKGEEYWKVFEILIKETNEKIYVKLDWYYNSWDWSEINSIFQVEPKEITVTKYFRV